MHPAGSNLHTLIIGGGASGLAAACVLARAGLPFTLLEKENKPARKLLATGNGRCNLMNVGEPLYYGDAAFAQAVLSHCGSKAVAAFFNSLGLRLFEEELGRVYPTTRQAASVRDCLEAGIAAFPGGQVLCGRELISLQKTQGGFLAETAQGQAFEADAVLLCSGGPAAPKLGGSCHAARLLTAFGHSLQPFFPALSPLITQTKPLKGLSGQRFPVILTLVSGDETLAITAGELLVTDYGVSGLCAMQLARQAQEALQAGQSPHLLVDFSPLLGIRPAIMGRLLPGEYSPGEAIPEIAALLKQREAALGKSRVYTGLLPPKMAQAYQGLPLAQAASNLGKLALEIKGVKGFDQAQVAAGGLDCRDFDPRTLESKLVPGLFACGEALNVDGDTGGFNLLFAWATGILAATSLVEAQAKSK